MNEIQQIIVFRDFLLCVYFHFVSLILMYSKKFCIFGKKKNECKKRMEGFLNSKKFPILELVLICIFEILNQYSFYVLQQEPLVIMLLCEWKVPHVLNPLQHNNFFYQFESIYRQQSK